VLRTSFWFTIAAATACLAIGVALSRPLARVLFEDGGAATLVALSFVGLWAQMNYEQLTAVFRVEERSTAFLAATLANVLITIGATVVLVVGLGLRAEGVIVGSFVGTLTVYVVLLAWRRSSSASGSTGTCSSGCTASASRSSRPRSPSGPDVLRPLPARGARGRGGGRALLDRRPRRLGLVLLLTAFRMAWPAFAYSITDDEEARRVYAYVLTYLLVLSSWVALALGVLAPWIVRLLTTPAFQPAEDVVAPLAFGGVALRRVHGARDRRRPSPTHGAELGRSRASRPSSTCCSTWS
jgi:O-antigen/teichoic acid export membrane protein